MKNQRMNLGPTPEVSFGSVGGDAEVRGGEYAETTVDTDGPDHNVLQVGSSLNVGNTAGDCALRLPQGGHVRFENVGGDMKVKGVFGGAQINNVGGDFTARRCGSISLDRSAGCVDVRDVHGEVSLGEAGCDVVVQECTGAVKIGTVGGDCIARDVPQGLHIEHVDDDVLVQTAIAPGASFKVHAGADLDFRLAAGSSARLIVPADADLDLDSALNAVAEGDRLIVTVGDGEATAELSAGGTIQIRMEGSGDRGTECDVDPYVVSISAQIDTHLRGLEQHLDDLPERVRNRVERQINSAMRQVKSAEREVQRAAEREKRGPWVFTPWRSSEPVSDEERMAILKMLEEGKITVQDAQKLLASLEGEG